MASKTVYKYRYYDTDLLNFQTVWQESKPIGSNIDVISVTIIYQISKDLIQVTNNDDTKGHYMLEGLKVNIPGDTTKFITTKSFPTPISCYSVYCYPTASNVGDSISCYIPLPIVSVSQNIIVGSSNVMIPEFLRSYIDTGFNISLSNMNGIESLGQVIDINNTTLTTEYSTSNAYSIGDKIITKIYFVKDMYIPCIDKFTIGQSTLNGSYIHAKTPIIIEYFNNNSNAKVMTYHIEYTY